MSDDVRIEDLGEHRYLLSAVQDGEAVIVEIYATPSVVTAIRTAVSGEVTEARIVDAAARWLLSRQRIDDLPGELELDEVAAAYEGFEADLRDVIRAIAQGPSAPTN